LKFFIIRAARRKGVSRINDDDEDDEEEEEELALLMGIFLRSKPSFSN
jgi:hypothetical protein